MTGVLGVLLDAWDEVRVHRSRVVLSLVGIVLAVFAMTITTAAGLIFGQIVRESTERATGRDATLVLYANAEAGARAPDNLYGEIVKRYGVTYSSLVSQSNLQVPVAYGAKDGPDAIDADSAGSGYESQPSPQVFAVEPDYAVIHRLGLSSGRWLTPSDATILAPSVVVNADTLTALGVDPARRAPFTLRLPGSSSPTVIVVGVVDRQEGGPTLWVLREDAKDVVPDVDLSQGSLELWVPPARADQLSKEINRLVVSRGFTGEVQPPFSSGLEGILLGLQILILVLSLFALFLGALGVLNVGVVTVRQRVREIGVRRALGASSARIFCAVMLESVLATMLAGLVGIAAAVALVNNFPFQLLPEWAQLSDTVAFPVAAAVEAFVAATVVGALVGLVPATIAVRAKVIDAIRY